MACLVVSLLSMAGFPLARVLAQVSRYQQRQSYTREAETATNLDTAHQHTHASSGSVTRQDFRPQCHHPQLTSDEHAGWILLQGPPDRETAFPTTDHEKTLKRSNDDIKVNQKNLATFFSLMRGFGWHRSVGHMSFAAKGARVGR